MWAVKINWVKVAIFSNGRWGGTQSQLFLILSWTGNNCPIYIFINVCTRFFGTSLPNVGGWGGWLPKKVQTPQNPPKSPRKLPFSTKFHLFGNKNVMGNGRWGGTQSQLFLILSWTGNNCPIYIFINVCTRFFGTSLPNVGGWGGWLPKKVQTPQNPPKSPRKLPFSTKFHLFGNKNVMGNGVAQAGWNKIPTFTIFFRSMLNFQLPHK